MPVSKNTWNKGLNSDLSKLKSQPDSYLNASNIRVITDEGTSTFSIENIKGNKFSFKLPSVEATYKISFVNITGNVVINIQRNNIIQQFTLNNVETKSLEFLSNELNALIQASTILPEKQYIKVYYNVNYLVLYDFLPQSSVNSLIITSTNNVVTLRTDRIIINCILGWGYYNDNLVILSCSTTNNDEEPINKEGFIWDCKYDNKTNSIVNNQIDSQGYLLPLDTLKYAGKLNLSRQYAIVKHLKCRYESTEIARLVWTDWYNNLRTCNLLDPQIWATPEELFSYIPQHSPQKPIIRQLITGGTLPTAKYQYFYQLYSNQGASSTYSPLSSLMSLYPGDLSNYSTPGNVPGVNSQKSIKIDLNDLDTNYDFIRIGYVVYQIADFPEAFFFDERPIPENGAITIIHNGNENDIPVDFLEIANLNRPPEIFKTIDVVRNRLFAANAITKYFDPIFDARAYRFKSANDPSEPRVAKLYNVTDTFNTPSVIINAISNEITIEGNPTPGIDYNLIPDNFDCINPFNNEDPDSSVNPLSNANWVTNSQYKYQSNGITLGGEGVNIKYEFITKEMLADIGGDNLYKDSPLIRPDLDYIGEYISEFSDTYNYAGSSATSLDSMKNPYLESIFTGYSRGEVYRWGIVFFDIYGYPSYVNWIGDIKFPFAYDNGGTFGLTNTLNDLGEILVGFKATLNLSGEFSIYPFTIEINNNIIWQGQISTVAQFITDFNTNNTGGFIVAGATLDTLIFFIETDDTSYINSQISAITTSSLSFLNVTETLTPVYESSTLGRNNLYTKQLGIKFTLNINTPQFQAIKDQITGWSYVRVRRDIDNSTRLGTGAIQPVSYFEAGQTNGQYTLMPYERNNAQAILLLHKWFMDQLDDNTDKKRARAQLQTFYSPNFLNKLSGNFIDGDYIRMLARTENLGGLIQYSEKLNIQPSWPSNSHWFYVKSTNFNYTYTDNVSVTIEPPSPDTVPTRAIDDFTNTTKFKLFANLYVNPSVNENRIPANTIPNLDFAFINMATSNASDAASNEYMEWGNACNLLSFQIRYPDTTNVFNNSTLKLPIYLCSYERYLSVQYGGWLRSDRYSNEYILTNHFQPWDKNTSEEFYQSNSFNGLITNGVYGGDTYVNYYDYQRTNINYQEGSGWGTADQPSNNPPFGIAIFFPCESSFNTELNVTKQHASFREDSVASGSNSILNSSYVYNSALSQQNSTNIFISKGFNQTNVKYEPHTIYGTEPKLDNERLDSWRKLLINNALTVNGNYGEINRIVQFKDKLYYYQNDGFGIASVDERVLANEGDTSQTQLGTGTLLQRFDYISTETGVKHSFAVETTGSAIYHYDAFINKMFRYSMSKDGAGVSPLTDIKGLSGFFRTRFQNTNLKSEDKLLRSSGDGRVGISSNYNSEYNSVYFTFFCRNNDDNVIEETISYNELLDSFESFYDFYPSLYLNMRKRFISVNPTSSSTNNEVYIHNIGERNTFYNQQYPSSVTFRVNENSDFVKTFDNFIINTEVILNNIQLAETISEFSIVNDYQIVNQQNANFTQKIRSWRKQIPRDETNPNLTIKPRISDKYIDVTFTHDPLNLDKTFRLHDVLTEYSMRSKILPR